MSNPELHSELQQIEARLMELDGLIAAANENRDVATSQKLIEENRELLSKRAELTGENSPTTTPYVDNAKKQIPTGAEKVKNNDILGEALNSYAEGKTWEDINKNKMN